MELFSIRIQRTFQLVSTFKNRSSQYHVHLLFSSDLVLIGIA